MVSETESTFINQFNIPLLLNLVFMIEVVEEVTESMYEKLVSQLEFKKSFNRNKE